MHFHRPYMNMEYFENDQRKKEIFFTKNYIFVEVPAFYEKVVCLHCNRVFMVGDFSIADAPDYTDTDMEYFIMCPFDDCSGSLIDWVDENWEGISVSELSLSEIKELVH